MAATASTSSSSTSAACSSSPVGSAPMRELSRHRHRRGAVGPLAGLPLGAPLRGRAVLARGVRRRRRGRLGARAGAGGVPARRSPDGPNAPYQGALELVDAVRRRCRPGCLSNMNPSSGRANYEAIAADARPSPSASSPSSSAWSSPTPPVFEAVAARLPVPRQRVLFLDDNAVNVDAAPRRAGSRPVTCAASTARAGLPWWPQGVLGGLSRPRRPDPAERRLGQPRRLCQHAAMVANGPMLRLLPRLDDDVAFFWTSGEDGVLRFLRCNDCGFFIHPPGPVCPRCLSRNVAPAAVSGRGHVETFTVNYQQWIPGSDPYIIAWVSIDEQPDVPAHDEPGRRRARGRAHRHAGARGLRARRGRLAPALHAGGGAS